MLDGFAIVQRKNSEEEEFNEFVHELQGVAIATDCTMFLLGSAMGGKETSEYTIVDGIVELSDELLGWSAESTLQVLKLRGIACLRGRHADGAEWRGPAERSAGQWGTRCVHHDGNGSVRSGQDDVRLAVPVPVRQRQTRAAVRLIRDASASARQGKSGLRTFGGRALH